MKNAILQNSDQTFSRKFQELFLAIKLDNNYSKDQILENYLNTIYYGRGAYGIESAANTYFGVPGRAADRAAGRRPRRPDPQPLPVRPRGQPRGRPRPLGRVLDAMVEEGWLTAGGARRVGLPAGAAQGRLGSLGIPAGPEGLIVQQAIERARGASTATPSSRSDAGGLRITTTVNKGYQDAAVAAVNEVMEGEDRELLREALVAVDPKTGAVAPTTAARRARTSTTPQAQRQPGSSIKPYVLATAPRAGHRRDGPPRRQLAAGVPRPRGAGAQLRRGLLPGVHADRGDHPVAEHHLLRAGLRGRPGERGRDGAQGHRACPTSGRAARRPVGKTTLANPDRRHRRSSIGIGEYEMRPIDQAVGFATFASGGVQRDAVLRREGDRQRGHGAARERRRPGRAGMSADVANDVTYAIKDVAEYSGGRWTTAGRWPARPAP